MWIGSDEWEWRPSRWSVKRSGGRIPRTHLWEQEGSMDKAVFGVRIPEPFPKQRVSCRPEPIWPYIELERLEFDLIKVVGVKETDGACIVWGSILVRESRFLEGGRKVINGSFNAKDPIVMALDDAGYLIPQSVDAYVRRLMAQGAASDE